MATVKSGSTLLLVGLLSVLSCADDPVEIPESQFGEPVCMVATSWGHWNDGRMHFILDESVNLAPAGCACLPPEDRHVWDEETLDMLAELTLVECEHMAETLFDFDWNDCQADFEAKAWYQHVWYVGLDGNTAGYFPEYLHCIDATP